MSLTKLEDEFEEDVVIIPISRYTLSVNLGEYQRIVSVLREQGWPPRPEEVLPEEELLALLREQIDFMSGEIAKDAEWSEFIENWTNVVE